MTKQFASTSSRGTEISKWRATIELVASSPTRAQICLRNDSVELSLLFVVIASVMSYYIKNLRIGY